MPQAINIIGTDTGIGKTYTCIKLLEYLIKLNFRVAAIKPVATGVVKTKYGSINEDAKFLLEASNYKLTPNQVNPICFSEPVSPNIAACKSMIELNVIGVIESILPTLVNSICDYILLEGVGGLMVPFNCSETYLDFLKIIKQPTVLVVGIKLGCLNHTLLTLNELMKNKVDCVGWIANFIDPLMLVADDNLQFLQAKLPIPLLASINYKGGLIMTQAGVNYFK